MNPPRNIKVVGVGDAGGAAINRLIDEGVNGIDLIAANTNRQAIREVSKAPIRIELGYELLQGLGAGGVAERGRQAAETSLDELSELLHDAAVVYIVAGMGGGTGSGASPVIAEVARKRGARTVAVVSRPFSFEGDQRQRNADQSIVRLRNQVDELIEIENDHLLRLAGATMPLQQAYSLVAGALAWQTILQLI